MLALVFITCISGASPVCDVDVVGHYESEKECRAVLHRASTIFLTVLEEEVRGSRIFAECTPVKQG